jgi:hypothetical protein
MKMLMPFAVAGLLMVSTAAALACTAQDVQTKAMQVTQKIQELAQKDPSKLQTISTKAQEGSQKLQAAMAAGKGLDEVCKFYDELLAEMSK